MESFFPIKLPKQQSSRVLAVMSKLVKEEKPLMAGVVYSNSSPKTQRKIRRLLKVKTKAGVISKLSPKHKKQTTK